MYDVGDILNKCMYRIYSIYVPYIINILTNILRHIERLELFLIMYTSFHGINLKLLSKA